VFSFYQKRDTRAAQYDKHTKGKKWALSFVTVGELLLWANIRNWGPTKVANLKASIERTGVIPYDEQLCQTYADLENKLRKAGKKVGDNDLWIAATAVRHSIPLISHNRKDYDNIPDLVLISETPKALDVQMNLENTRAIEL
jgi:predicted nucleic acid-binding protein